MQSYQAARGLFGFLGFCSWIVIIVGGLAAFGGFATAASTVRNASMLTSLLWTVPGLLLAVVGLYGLAVVQMGRAGVDTAEYTQQMLKVSRDHFEHSKRTYADLHQGTLHAKGYTSSDGPEAISYDTDEPSVGYENQSQEATSLDPELLSFEGQTIERTETGFLVGNSTFPSLEDAKSFVLSLPSNAKDEALIEVPDTTTETATLGYAKLTETNEPETEEDLIEPEPDEPPEPDQASLIAALPIIETIKHGGTAIDQVEGGYCIGTDFFLSLDDAKKAIEDPNLRPFLTQPYPVS